MATDAVNRQAWARVVRDALETETKAQKWGAKTRLANRARVTVRTIDTWLAGAVDVKESSVRALAEAYDLDIMGLLIEVGYYTREQLPWQPTDAEIDEEQAAVINRDGLSGEVKAEILRRLDDLRTTDNQWIAEMEKRNRDRRQAEIDYLIRRAQRSA